jgi:hypothetical protein
MFDKSTRRSRQATFKRSDRVKRSKIPAIRRGCPSIYGAQTADALLRELRRRDRTTKATLTDCYLWLCAEPCSAWPCCRPNYPDAPRG